MISSIKQLNPFLFFLIDKGNVIAWDYKNRQQYELEKEYYLRLLEWSHNSDLEKISIDNELEEAELISASFAQVKWEWDVLSQIFHFGTKIKESDVSQQLIENPEYFVAEHIALAQSSLNSSPNFLTEKEGKAFILPPPDLSRLSKTDFLQILKTRKTSRSFEGVSIGIDTLSTLLYVVFGDFHIEKDDYSQYGYRQVGMRKTSPSAGGLHSSEAYVLMLNIEGFKQGVYHYQAHRHVLTLIQESHITSRICKLLCGQYYTQQLSFGIFITSRFDKIWHKYPHSRAYRVALLDVGHLSQTFQLAATALGLQTWLTGAFLDDEVASLLHLEDEAEQPIFFVGAGIGDNSPLDPVAKKMGMKNES